MAEKEQKTIRIKEPSEQASTVALWASFGWELESAYDVIKPETLRFPGYHHVELHFERDPSRSDYAELVSLENKYYEPKIIEVTKKNKRNTIIRCFIGGIIGAFIGLFAGVVGSSFVNEILAIIGLFIGAVIGAIYGFFTGDSDGAGEGAKIGATIFAIIFAIVFAIFCLIGGESFFMGIFGGAIIGAIGGAIIGALGNGIFYVEEHQSPLPY